MGVCCLRPVTPNSEIETSPKISNDKSKKKHIYIKFKNIR